MKDLSGYSVCNRKVETRSILISSTPETAKASENIECYEIQKSENDEDNKVASECVTQESVTSTKIISSDLLHKNDYLDEDKESKEVHVPESQELSLGEPKSFDATSRVEKIQRVTESLQTINTIQQTLEDEFSCETVPVSSESIHPSYLPKVEKSISLINTSSKEPIKDTYLSHSKLKVVDSSPETLKSTDSMLCERNIPDYVPSDESKINELTIGEQTFNPSIRSLPYSEIVEEKLSDKIHVSKQNQTDNMEIKSKVNEKPTVKKIEETKSNKKRSRKKKSKQKHDKCEPTEEDDDSVLKEVVSSKNIAKDSTMQKTLHDENKSDCQQKDDEKIATSVSEISVSESDSSAFEIKYTSDADVQIQYKTSDNINISEKEIETSQREKNKDSTSKKKSKQKKIRLQNKIRI
ncbi:hypothetical protein CEXT_265781 [Caerostris extrusa]|uniref:Uncharacterized protein n=1 Tax=Caerostris extrusa TaxID=172846 RepID=A0AAV4P6C0_CAEEX|nr:hypothetical protein CEXT_265781 [Caerostris extrusa]